MNLSSELDSLEKDTIEIRRYLKDLADPITKDQSLEIRSRLTHVLSQAIKIKEIINENSI
jgi:hypothetical protein